MRIVVSAGGTAGHVIPLLELALAFKRLGHRVLYVGSSEPERSLVKTIPFRPIRSGKLRRYLSLRNIVDPFNAAIGTLQALRILGAFRPDIVFVKGGYVSLPVVLAAAFKGLTLYSHESDLTMGWANRLALRFANTVFVAYPVQEYPAPWRRKLVYAGVPVRREFHQKSTAADRKLFGLTQDLPVVLVTGGSQGARGLNRLVFDSLKDLLQSCQVIHIAGPADASKAVELRNRLPFHLQERYRVYTFLKLEMPPAVRAADIVVTRGGSTLFELVAARKPVVIVPLPTAANDHQRKNAAFFQREYGYGVLEQERTAPPQFLAAVNQALDKKFSGPALPNSVEIIIKHLFGRK